MAKLIIAKRVVYEPPSGISLYSVHTNNKNIPYFKLNLTV